MPLNYWGPPPRVAPPPPTSASYVTDYDRYNRRRHIRRMERIYGTGLATAAAATAAGMYGSYKNLKTLSNGATKVIRAAHKNVKAVHNKLMSKRPINNNMSLRGSKSQKMDVDESQTSTLTNASVSQCSNAMDMLVAGNDIVANKRLPQYRFRLHKAVYLKMDPLLRKLLYPSTNIQLAFGFKSVSDNVYLDQNKDIDGHLGTTVSSSTTNKDAMPRGVWRGFACMVIRGYRHNASRTAINALNTQVVNAGSVSYTGMPTTNTNGIKSYYKLFANGPRLTGEGTANTPGSLATYPLTLGEGLPATTTTTPSTTPIRYLHLGENLSHIEQYAATTSRYYSPFVGNTAGPGMIGPGMSATVASQGQAPATQDYGLYSNTPSTGTQYNLTAKYCIQRISDGMVELDIMNTFQTCCVLEVVLIATKRECQSVQNLCNAISKGYAERHKQVPGTELLTLSHFTNNPPPEPYPSSKLTHAWETWFDPEVPFIKTTSKDKEFNTLATEIHRSNHVLAPGQTKRVTVYLGNLWYRLTERSTPSAARNVECGTDAPELGLGSIVAFVGHTGFDAPQSFTGWSSVLGNNSLNTNIFGTHVADPIPSSITNNLGHGIGQFVGRTKTPSSIMCEGKYSERFYPIVPESDGRTLGNYNAGNVGAYVEEGSDRYGFNHDQFVPQKVQTVSAGTVSVSGSSTT